MKCIKPGQGAIVQGVCGGCLHYIDEHSSDGTCLGCTEVFAAVYRKWATGTGNPPPGIPSESFTAMAEAEERILRPVSR